MQDGSQHPKAIKARLAKDICAQFYDDDTAQRAEAEFNAIFAKKELPDEIEEFSLDTAELTGGKIWIVKLLVAAKLAASNGEARRLIAGGGVYIDQERLGDADLELSAPFSILVKVGKRRFMRINSAAKN